MLHCLLICPECATLHGHGDYSVQVERFVDLGSGVCRGGKEGRRERRKEGRKEVDVSIHNG